MSVPVASWGSDGLTPAVARWGGATEPAVALWGPDAPPPPVVQVSNRGVLMWGSEELAWGTDTLSWGA